MVNSVFSMLRQTSMSKLIWRLGLLGAALILIGCQGQTFQYSRGWTNGKRGGYYNPPSVLLSNTNGASQNQIFDVENGVGSLEDPASPAAGGFRAINPDAPAGRQSGGRLGFRERDYPQAGRKLGSGVNSSNSRKQPPFWILGVAGQENNASDI